MPSLSNFFSWLSSDKNKSGLLKTDPTKKIKNTIEKPEKVFEFSELTAIPKSELFDISQGRPIRAYATDGKFIDFSTDDLVGHRLNYFQGWSCGVGVENLYVDMDGDIYGATCQVGGKLGNIYGDFEIPSQWQNCPRKACGCGSDLFIPKVKTMQDKSLLLKTNSIPPVLNKRVPSFDGSFAFSAIERTHASTQKQVYWQIGRRCNYNCSYCWPDVHNKSERHKSLDELVKATDKVLEKFTKGSRVNFIISGGEPSLNPDFLTWAQYISEKGHHLSTHSNGSRLPDYYRKLIHFGDLNLSAHFEYLNPQKFIKVVAAVTEEKAKQNNTGIGHLEVKIMMSPGRRQEALDLQCELLKIEMFTTICSWAFVPIRTGDGGEDIQEGYEAADHILFGSGSL